MTCQRKDLVELYSDPVVANKEVCKEPRLIMINDNECPIESDWSVHDYAHFNAKELLEIESILNSIRKETEKQNNIATRSRRVEALWMKLKAVSLFVGSAHRKGSWYTVESDNESDLVDDILSETKKEIKCYGNVDDLNKIGSLDISIATLSSTKAWNELARITRRQRFRSMNSCRSFFNRICHCFRSKCHIQ
ncbi:hypothetical protein GJ496_011994 [Pomphorhynchus laevis]|nr:hypothetical protein GJ496_011994 [Pomphorhynchus laevis]